MMNHHVFHELGTRYITNNKNRISAVSGINGVAGLLWNYQASFRKWCWRQEALPFLILHY